MELLFWGDSGNSFLDLLGRCWLERHHGLPVLGEIVRPQACCGGALGGSRWPAQGEEGQGAKPGWAFRGRGRSGGEAWGAVGLTSGLSDDLEVKFGRLVSSNLVRGWLSVAGWMDCPELLPAGEEQLLGLEGSGVKVYV